MSRARTRLAAAVLLWLPPTLAAASPAEASEHESMSALYAQLEPSLADTAFGAPIHLESELGAGEFTSSVYAVVDHSFERTVERLQHAESWCGIVSLHLNVKACTHSRNRGSDQVALYLGRKFYQKADNATRFDMRFQPYCAPDEPYFIAVLESDKGPLGTHDYRLALDAIPIDEERTFLRFRYGYRYGQLAWSSQKIYFWTLGYGKIGFSRESGENKAVSGVQGALERNAMRYHLAILADLETSDVESSERFDRRTALWYDLTERYHEQLFEISRDEYLANKRRELADQQRLQARIDTEANLPRVAAAPAVDFD